MFLFQTNVHIHYTNVKNTCYNNNTKEKMLKLIQY